MAIAEKFWERVQPSDGCWLWTAGHGSEGYGCLWIAGHSWKAHRAAWALIHGPIPEGMDVLHICDNPPCVRPDHLWLGTRGDNNRDRAVKGRSAKGATHGTHTHPYSYRGERHGRAKLTAADIRAIRAQRRAGLTQVALAERFVISRRNIRSILNGSSWGWLP